VFDALSTGLKLERERLHSEEEAIAQLTAIYFNSQKTKPPYLSRTDFYIYPPLEESSIPAEVCNTFLALVKEQILPSWALRLSPVEEIQKGASEKVGVAKVRLWMCRGLALICPNFEQEVLTAGLAIIDDDAPSGRVAVWDVDTNEEVLIWIPEISEPYIVKGHWSWELQGNRSF
jgi:hypothetical protein